MKFIIFTVQCVGYNVLQCRVVCGVVHGVWCSSGAVHVQCSTVDWWMKYSTVKYTTVVLSVVHTVCGLECGTVQ